MKLEMDPCQVLRIPSDIFTYYCCREDCIAMLLHWKGRSYKNIFAGSMNFSYQNHKLKYEESNYPLLKQFYGIQLELRKPLPFSLENSLKLIQSQLDKGTPVLLGVDCYWVPWDSGYQLNHNRGHFFLVVDIDWKDEALVCVDGYFNEKNVKLTFDHYLKGFARWAFFENAATEEKEIRIRDLLTNHSSEDIVRLSESVASDSMDFYIHNLPLYIEENRSRHWGVFSRIADGRVEYSIFLKEHAKQMSVYQNRIQELADQIWSCGEQWHLVKLALERAVPPSRRGKQLKEASERLIGIAAQEKEIKSEIIELIGSDLLMTHYTKV